MTKRRRMTRMMSEEEGWRERWILSGARMAAGAVPTAQEAQITPDRFDLQWSDYLRAAYIRAKL